jgi:hypothetical protein
MDPDASLRDQRRLVRGRSGEARAVESDIRRGVDIHVEDLEGELVVRIGLVRYG